MIELQSVGLKFGLASNKESEYKYSDSFKQRKKALFSALRESLGFWNFDYSEMFPLVMPAQLLLPWQILNFKSTGYVIQETSVFLFEKPFVVPLDVLRDEDFFNSWADSYTSYSYTDSNILSAMKYESDSHRIKSSGQVALSDIDGYYKEGLYCFVLPGYAITSEAYLSGAGEFLNYIVSEPFSFSKNVDDYTTFLFGNNINLELGNGAEIDFSEGFFFKMLLPSQLGRPNYVFEDTLTERQGYKFVENQVSKKTYDLSFPANESMCDTLRIARLCCNRQMKSLDRYHDIIAMDMTVDWLEQGDIASVKMTIEEDNIINHNGGYLGITDAGDFDKDDFNNDYFDVVDKGLTFNFSLSQQGPGFAQSESSCNNTNWIGEDDTFEIPDKYKHANKIEIGFSVLQADGAVRIELAYNKDGASTYTNLLPKTFLDDIEGGIKKLEINVSDLGNNIELDSLDIMIAANASDASVANIQGYIKLT